MAVACKSRLLVLCVSAIVAFIVQSTLCFVERAGLVCCKVHTEEHQNSADSDQQSQSSQSDCCSTHCHTAVVTLDATGAPIGDVQSDFVLKFHIAAPDSPVREIDHPPQLS